MDILGRPYIQFNRLGLCNRVGRERSMHPEDDNDDHEAKRLPLTVHSDNPLCRKSNMMRLQGARAMDPNRLAFSIGSRLHILTFHEC